ncbi:MAG: hypothetical protein NZ898_03745 [Myxococcota bacterium]|nr:hypothetical protein [Myxococcota bacterium]MDW8363675.1 hypothetical protein [Myxococcales bacterium]
MSMDSLSSLSEDDDALLLGLLRELVQADGRLSDAERAHLAKVRSAMGDDRFVRAMQAASSRFGTREALKQAARALTDEKRQRAIFDVVRTVAASDGLTDEEQAPLRWLASWWGIRG